LNLQTSQVVAVVVVVGVIGLGLGVVIGYGVYQGRTTSTYITNPEGLSTVTKMVVVSDALHEAEYVCGNSTPYAAGTVEISSTNSTQYIFSPSGNYKFLNVTVTTEISTVSTTIVDSTVTLRSTTQDNTTVCPTMV
jgi:hypothetical protein